MLNIFCQPVRNNTKTFFPNTCFQSEAVSHKSVILKLEPKQKPVVNSSSFFTQGTMFTVFPR